MMMLLMMMVIIIIIIIRDCLRSSSSGLSGRDGTTTIIIVNSWWCWWWLCKKRTKEKIRSLFFRSLSLDLINWIVVDQRTNVVKNTSIFKVEIGFSVLLFQLQAVQVHIFISWKFQSILNLIDFFLFAYLSFFSSISHH